MTKTEFTNICTAYTEKIQLTSNTENNDKAHTHLNMLCLMLTTYPKNVPEPKDYTVEDMLNLANDPVLLNKYGAPFCVMSLFHQERPALFVTPNAIVDIASYMEQPSMLENTTVVLRASQDLPPVVADIRNVIADCAIPEKLVYGCYGCLSLANVIPSTCCVRNIVGANNPYYGVETEEDKSKFGTYYQGIKFYDDRIIKSWGKYESPFVSQKTKISGHLYVSPTMLYEPSRTDKKYHRAKSNVFVSLRDITLENIDLDSYEEHSERKQDAIDTRRKHTNNAKTHCTVCSVKETCHTNFKHKKKYCTHPYPPNEEINKHFLKDDTTSISKDTIVDILMASGSRNVTNPDTNRKCDAFISIHNGTYGLGFRVIARTTGKILVSGTTDKEWIDFKTAENINTEYSNYIKTELHEKLNDTTWYAKLLACAAIQWSPTRVSMFHSTSYAKAYIERIYEGFSVKFLWTSQRRLCPWNYEVKDWEDLFGHYGRIPGFR